MGLWVVGCDICQAVCPRNKGKQPGAPAPIDEARPLLADLMALTPEAFEARFRHTAAGWRGVKILRRNGAVALENWWTYSGF
jgi:epoxyqueuosine reductase